MGRVEKMSRVANLPYAQMNREAGYYLADVVCSWLMVKKRIRFVLVHGT